MLHQYHSNSRLHVSLFSLRSLIHYKDPPGDIDRDEFALANSLCLYSITAFYSDYDCYGMVNFNKEAVLQMVVETAPRLKTVRIRQYEAADSLELRDAYNTPRPPWAGFFADEPQGSTALTQTVKTKGHLRNLVLAGVDSAGSDEIVSWSLHTGFSELETLGITLPVDTRALLTLKGLVEMGEFQSLRSLALSVEALDGQDLSRLDTEASVLLHALPLLESLKLTGSVAEETLSSILNHQQRLRRFHFVPIRHRLMAFHMRRFQQHCPNLQDLTLSIRRTMGRDQEVDIYRALGGLRQLKRASLFLNCAKEVHSY